MSEVLLPGMFRNPRRVFFLIILLTILLIAVDLPENYPLKINVAGIKINEIINPLKINLNVLGFKIERSFTTHLGLDLSGGTQVVLEADMKDIIPADRTSAIDSAKQVIERRVNFFGVSEPIVQTSKENQSYRIIVELPGIQNVDAAVALIGQTAKLEFRELVPSNEATTAAIISLENTKSVGITGKDLKSAQIQFSSQTGEPEVGLIFTADGAKKFAEVTGRLVGKPLAIFLDDLVLTAPRVNQAIADGQAVITGQFSSDQAKTLSLQLNAGALPVPVRVIQKQTVGATLGLESVVKSLRAGVIGLVIVAAFMIAKYGTLGLLADMALILYGLATFAIFRLIPITLTLPGIAGFILSMGMAVDANILIFERFKEELRHGKPLAIAMELGFGKAWQSIRDANFTTIITSIILYNPANSSLLPSSGLVRGFAATLLIGVLVSLFTGIIVTRTLIRVLYLPSKIK